MCVALATALAYLFRVYLFQSCHHLRTVRIGSRCPLSSVPFLVATRTDTHSLLWPVCKAVLQGWPILSSPLSRLLLHKAKGSPLTAPSCLQPRQRCHTVLGLSRPCQLGILCRSGCFSTPLKGLPAGGNMWQSRMQFILKELPF